MGDHVLLSRPIFISQAIYKAAGVPRISPRWRDAILPVKSSDYVSEERDTRDSPLSWVYRGNRNTRMISRSFAKGTTARNVGGDRRIGDVRNIPTQLQRNVHFFSIFPRFYFSLSRPAPHLPNVNEEPPVWHGINPVVTSMFSRNRWSIACR